MEMPAPALPRRTTASLVSALLPCVALLCACARPHPVTNQEAAAAATPPAAPASAVPSPAPAPAASEQHDWQTDDSGKRYYLSTYPKSYPHRLGEGGRLRTVWGVEVRVDHEDDENFFVRVYEEGPTATGPSPNREISEEVKASYRLQVPTVDRLSFQPFDQALPRNGQWRNGFDIADIDGDGKLDIVHGPPRKALGRGPSIFLGDGKGHWRRWTAKFPSFPYDYGDAAVGDLDGDGRNDIVLGVHLHGIVALVQKQPGQFELWNQGLPYRMGPSAPMGFSSRAVAVLDWNADGRPDIAALSEGPQLQIDRSGVVPASGGFGLMVYLNGGDGTWRTNPVVESAAGLFGDSLEATDFDRDGRPDLLSGSSAENKRGLIQLSVDGEKGTQVDVTALRKGYTRAVAAADVDGNGTSELVASFLSREPGQWQMGIDVLFRAADETWERRLVWVEQSNTGIWSLAAGDIDGDHHPDLVALTGDGRMIVLLNDGAGGFAQQPVTTGEEARGCLGTALRLRDLDDDGRDEIVAAFAGEPGGMPGLGTMENRGCTGGGRIAVWKTVPAAAGG